MFKYRAIYVRNVFENPEQMKLNDDRLLWPQLGMQEEFRITLVHPQPQMTISKLVEWVIFEQLRLYRNDVIDEPRKRILDASLTQLEIAFFRLTLPHWNFNILFHYPVNNCANWLIFRVRMVLNLPAQTYELRPDTPWVNWDLPKDHSHRST